MLTPVAALPEVSGEQRGLGVEPFPGTDQVHPALSVPQVAPRPTARPTG